MHGWILCRYCATGWFWWISGLRAVTMWSSSSFTKSYGPMCDHGYQLISNVQTPTEKSHNYCTRLFHVTITQNYVIFTLSSCIIITVTCHQQPRRLTFGVPSECLGTRSWKSTSRGKIEMFFCSTVACNVTVAKSTIANRHRQINAHLYSASFICLIWQQCHWDSHLDTVWLIVYFKFRLQTVLATLFCSNWPVFVWLVRS